jgi:type II secretory pathway pseudopilin PulG
MTVFVLAMLFAIAIPNFAEARRSAQELQEEALMEQAERQKTEEVLTKGEMPAAFVGTWAGRNPTTGDEYLAWQTLRASDGSLTTHFTSSKGSEQSRWTKTGQWRVFENVYYEIVEGKIELEMTVKAVQEDKIELLGDTEDEESLMTETREKP